MNFLALLLGLAVERLLTNLFHLREFHWLDPLFDWFFNRYGSGDRSITLLATLVALLIAIAPVALVYFGLQDRFAHIPLFVFSIFVLLFCLGPRDLGEEVSDYRQAIEVDDIDEIQSLATELLENGDAQVSAPPDIEKAVYAQANNRIFGVVFWFAVLGPVGAWLFRALDLLRRRAVVYYEAHEAGSDTEETSMVSTAILLHRIFAWLPARLLMAGYAMAGSYDAAVSIWRRATETDGFIFTNDSQLLGEVGQAAAPQDAGQDVSERAQVAIDLVVRTLWMIWCPVLALLTLYGALN
jgi:AmpE protein